jgi:hypothetical protein
MRQCECLLLLLPLTDKSKAVRRLNGLLFLWLLLVLLVLLVLRRKLLRGIRVLLAHELLRALFDGLETVRHLPELTLEVFLFLRELEQGRGPLGQGVSLLSPAGTGTGINIRYCVAYDPMECGV